MNTILETFYNSFLKDLETINASDEPLLVHAKNCRDASILAMKNLRDYVSKNSFISKQEEIIFFKITKPKFHSELIYWADVYRIELHMPEGRQEAKEKYLRRQLVAIEMNFSNNASFIYYYKSGEIFMDEEYFLMKNQIDDLYNDRDRLFSTRHDFTVARILADNKLQKYLNDAMNNIKDTASKNEVNKQEINTLKWTASKAGLVELIYALQCCGVYNNGVADIREIAMRFEKLFHVDLGNYYNIFNEIRLRKKSRTQLLDQLKEKLMMKIDELDEK